MADYDGERRVGFEIKLRTEAEAVLCDAVFRRSPVLSKLLRYLVEETANGRGDTLKSYSVAVEVLGRPASFDCATDSSARVHMVRLRKALENQYALHGPVDGECLYMRPGCYKIRLGKLSVAYPQLYRPLSDEAYRPNAVFPELVTNSAPTALDEKFSQASPSVTGSQPRFHHYKAWLGAGFMMCMVFALLGWFAWQQYSNSGKAPVSPILEMLQVENATGPELTNTSRIISSTFAKGLPEFNISRVRIIDQGSYVSKSGDNENVYRLVSKLVGLDAGSQQLYLRLIDAQTDVTLWSHDIRLGNDPKTIPNELAPLIADINGPFGVIATHGTTLHRERNDAGYACLLKYYAFVQSRSIQSEKDISVCLEKPTKEKILYAPMQAARALFTIERSAAINDFDSSLNQAMTIARRAVATDPNDGLANFALARLSYLKEDCVSALFYTGRAAETNANSPFVLPYLAALAPTCNDPGARALLDQAFLSQSMRFPRGRLLLVMAALQLGRVNMVAKIKPSDVPQSDFSLANYYLTESLIAGAKGQRNVSARRWAQFAATQTPSNRSPDELLRLTILRPGQRRRMVEHLKTFGAFES